MPLLTLPSILVVDDDAHFCQMLTFMLSRRGFTAQGVESGETALNFAATSQAALVDMVMPGMSGIETIEELRHRNPALRFIATSGCDERQFRADLDRLGVARFLLKPFAVETLFDLLKHEVPRGAE